LAGSRNCLAVLSRELSTANPPLLRTGRQRSAISRHRAGPPQNDTLGVMIKDASTLSDIRAQWNAVRTLASRGATGAQIPGGPYVNFPPKDSRFYNLPFLLAYATLEQVLELLAYEGTIPPPKEKPTLHTRMNASQSHLPWQSFATVDEGKRRRNALAHDATLLDEQDCLHYIRAVEEELVAWSIIHK